MLAAERPSTTRVERMIERFRDRRRSYLLNHDRNATCAASPPGPLVNHGATRGGPSWRRIGRQRPIDPACRTASGTPVVDRSMKLIRRMHESLEGGRDVIDQACILVCSGLLAAMLTIALAVAVKLAA